MCLQPSAPHAFPSFAGKLLPTLLAEITSLRSLAPLSQVKLALLTFVLAQHFPVSITHICIPHKNVTLPVQNSSLQIPSALPGCLVYHRINTHLLDWWMNLVLPVSIIPCPSILTATIFENLQRARHSIVVILFNFRTGTMNEKVLSLLQMKAFKLRKFDTEGP